MSVRDRRVGSVLAAPGHGEAITTELHPNLFRVYVDGDDFFVDTNRNDSIPSKKVFVGNSELDEKWAYAFPNPWCGSLSVRRAAT
jgi:hypothetical protein